MSPPCYDSCRLNSCTLTHTLENVYRAPWLKDVWFFGSSYIIPNVDTVVLGGTAGKGDWSTAVSLQDTETILSNIEKVFPSIRDAPIVSLPL